MSSARWKMAICRLSKWDSQLTLIHTLTQRKFDSIRLAMQLESASIIYVGVDNINHMIVLEPGWLSPGLKYIIVKQLQELACKRICY
eukprot:scaffold12293_cov120-Skeletonema_marinoi.AAC.2